MPAHFVPLSTRALRVSHVPNGEPLLPDPAWLADVLLRFSFAEAALAYDRRPEERYGVFEGASGWAEGVSAVVPRAPLLPAPGPGFVWPAAWAEWVAALKGAGFNTRIMEM